MLAHMNLFGPTVTQTHPMGYGESKFLRNPPSFLHFSVVSEEVKIWTSALATLRKVENQQRDDNKRAKKK